MRNEFKQWSLVSTSKERAQTRTEHLMECLRFATSQKRKGWNIEEIIAQIETGFPKITYLDFLDRLNKKLCENT